MVEMKTTSSTSAAVACSIRLRRTVVVDYLGVVVALGAAVGSDDHGADTGHRLDQSLSAANVCDEPRHLGRKNLLALGGISHQRANGNAAFE